MDQSTSSQRVANDARSPRSVLFVTPSWTRDGGIATHVQSSARALAEQGLEVHVLTRRNDTSGEDGDGIKVLASESLMQRDATIDARLGEAASLSPDVIHLHQVDDPDVVAALRRQAPVVISAHGYTACTADVHYFKPGQECMRAHGPGCIPNLALRGCAHVRDPRPLPNAYRRTSRGVRALRAADLAVSYSSAVDRHLAINAVERRRVIPLFTTVAAAAGSGHEHRRRVLFAGRVVAPKGLAVLIRAVAQIEAELVVCGEGWQLERMRLLAHRLDVHDRVDFRGWLSAQALAGELAEASIVALPSIWPEPFGLVGIEAHAAGRPVVASATGGIADWLQDGVSGLLVKPGDAEDLARRLDELLADPERQRAMGAAGRQSVAARFSKHAHVEAVLDAYRAARLTWERSSG